MTRNRLALLLAVLTAAGAALVYGLLSQPPTVEKASPSLRPLIQKAALQPCFGEVASRSGAKGLLPDLRLKCLDDDGSRDLLFSEARIQTPTMVNVYGSWCGPCFDEMHLLRELHDAAGSRLRILGIDTEDDHRDALLFALDPKVGQTWPALRDDDGHVLRALGGGPPQTVFVSTTGQVVHVQRGPYSSYVALIRDVRRYLGVSL